MRYSLVAVLFLAASFITSFSSVALDLPQGQIILTISGSIERANKEDSAALDAAILKSLPQYTIETDTPWTSGITRFEGPLLRDVLELVGARGKVLKTIAINDYFVDIPVSDVETFDVLLAMRMDNRELTVRTKGPLWIIYPWSNHDKLRSETFYSRSIWQLEHIQVQ